MIFIETRTENKFWIWSDEKNYSLKPFFCFNLIRMTSFNGGRYEWCLISSTAGKHYCLILLRNLCCTGVSPSDKKPLSSWPDIYLWIATINCSGTLITYTFPGWMECTIIFTVICVINIYDKKDNNTCVHILHNQLTLFHIKRMLIRYFSYHPFHVIAMKMEVLF